MRKHKLSITLFSIAILTCLTISNVKAEDNYITCSNDDDVISSWINPNYSAYYVTITCKDFKEKIWANYVKESTYNNNQNYVLFNHSMMWDNVTTWHYNDKHNYVYNFYPVALDNVSKPFYDTTTKLITYDNEYVNYRLDLKKDGTIGTFEDTFLNRQTYTSELIVDNVSILKIGSYFDDVLPKKKYTVTVHSNDTLALQDYSVELTENTYLYNALVDNGLQDNYISLNAYYDLEHTHKVDLTNDLVTSNTDIYLDLVSLPTFSYGLTYDKNIKFNMNIIQFDNKLKDYMFFITANGTNSYISYSKYIQDKNRVYSFNVLADSIITIKIGTDPQHISKTYTILIDDLLNLDTDDFKQVKDDYEADHKEIEINKMSDIFTFLKDALVRVKDFILDIVDLFAYFWNKLNLITKIAIVCVFISKLFEAIIKIIYRK